MKLPGILPFTRQLLTAALKPGDIAIDATAGNGHDTLFLADAVGPTGKVYSFDIQPQAIKNTQERLRKNDMLDHVSLVEKGHEEVASVIPTKEHPRVKAAIFNLGYLPGGDKTVTTQSVTTLTAVQDMLDFMPTGAVIVLVIYHGHEEGKREKLAVERYAEALDQKKVHVLRYSFINQTNNPPFIIALEKR